MIEALVELPAYLRMRLVGALDSGLLGSPITGAAVQSVIGENAAQAGVLEGLLALERMGIAGRLAAAWLRTIESAMGRTRKPDLVWSGPELAGLPARDTRRVYDELLGGAERSVWASTYVFFDGPKTFQVLAGRMEA